MTHEIQQAFRRRESALNHFASAKSLLVNIYAAHQNWNWGNNGRQHLSEEHSDLVEKDIHDLLHMLSSYLCLPSVTRARNLFTVEGKAERIAQVPVQQHFFYHIYNFWRLKFKGGIKAC